MEQQAGSNPSSAAIGQLPIMFYDGECGLCARVVQWCLAHDRRGVLRYAPLQGSTYAALPLANKPDQLDTMALLDADGLHVRSSAALRVLRHIGGGWKALGVIGLLVPRPLRDAAYRVIAHHRKGWFGSADRCRLPEPGATALFLP